MQSSRGSNIKNVREKYQSKLLTIDLRLDELYHALWELVAIIFVGQVFLS